MPTQSEWDILQNLLAFCQNPHSRLPKWSPVGTDIFGRILPLSPRRTRLTDIKCWRGTTSISLFKGTQRCSITPIPIALVTTDSFMALTAYAIAMVACTFTAEALPAQGHSQDKRTAGNFTSHAAHNGTGPTGTQPSKTHKLPCVFAAPLVSFGGGSYRKRDAQTRPTKAARPSYHDPFPSVPCPQAATPTPFPHLLPLHVAQALFCTSAPLSSRPGPSLPWVCDILCGPTNPGEVFCSIAGFLTHPSFPPSFLPSFPLSFPPPPSLVDFQ